MNATVEAIATARLGHAPLPPLAAPPADEDAAYAVQAAVHARLAPILGPVAAFKIGCTTPVMCELLDIDHPCAGGILAATVRHGRATLVRQDFVRPGVECEIAVRLGRALEGSPRPSLDAVADAVASVMTAMEIVDDRYGDFRARGVPTLIADDFFAAGCVLGPEVADWRRLDLARLEAVTTIDGTVHGRGVGADVMGHPFAALAWLAERCGGLPAGALVLTGAVVAVHWLAGAALARAEIAGLGAVEARFTGA